MRGKPAVLKRADSRIWLFCRRLTGKQRIVLTSVVSLLFTAACLYSVVSSVSRLGERKGDMKSGAYPARHVTAGNNNHSFKHPET